MSKRIIKLVMDDGSSFDYTEKTINHFLKQEKSEAWAKRWFEKQYEEWQKEAISQFDIDLCEWAKENYALVDSDEIKEIEDFDDSDLLEEADYRGILPSVAEVENENILNADFIGRFVTIINRGVISEIENFLSLLESKYKIA